ncbi:MAG: pyridoxal-phosphate dependent enzyme [Candidatus Delongbacteria bacterium]|jgi:D-cysteine desulfhydrase|nr:pyridoxal-phosphate dependent enzyme [Candidatus Delongbacteria bacterium]
MSNKKINMLRLPTPLHKIDVDGKNNYYIKRDDLTDFALGGNKARKLEYFMFDILSKKSDCIVTYGSPHSNHCRLTAVAAAKFGLECHLILTGTKDDLKYNGNDLIFSMCDAKVTWCTPEKASLTIESTLNELSINGHKPYFIEGGGHGNLGTQAYLNAYLEIQEQAKELKIEFDYIFLASGTGTTQAGLIAGKLENKGKENIIGISIARKESRGKEVIQNSLADFFNSQTKYEYEKNINFDDSYIGTGYADIYPDISKSIKKMLKTNAIILDPVYTGKAYWGMTEFIKKHQITKSNILFLHTGGIPIYFEKGINLMHSTGVKDAKR